MYGTLIALCVRAWSQAWRVLKCCAGLPGSTGLCLLKVKLTDGKLDLPMGTARPLCLLTGKSPRGQHSHAVVAQISLDGASFELYHDPHPDGGGIDGHGNWAGFIVSLLNPSNSALPPTAKRSRVGQVWRATLQLKEDPDDDASTVTLSVDRQASKEAATAALAEVLHQRVFSKPISTDEGQNCGDYNSPEGFIESIRRERREHDADNFPDSITATLIWEALYEAIGTLKVEAC